MSTNHRVSSYSHFIILTERKRNKKIILPNKTLLLSIRQNSLLCLYREHGSKGVTIVERYDIMLLCRPFNSNYVRSFKVVMFLKSTTGRYWCCCRREWVKGYGWLMLR